MSDMSRDFLQGMTKDEVLPGEWMPAHESLWKHAL